jgi:hypothetical protein
MRSGYRGPNEAASEKYVDGGAMIRLNDGLILEEGDGAFILISKGDGDKSVKVDNVGDKDAEWLLFELE